jgi:hypothetical protein
MSRNPFQPPRARVADAVSASPPVSFLFDPVLRLAVAFVLLGLGGYMTQSLVLDLEGSRRTFHHPGELQETIAVFVAMALAGLLMLLRSRFVFIPFFAYWATVMWLSLHSHADGDWVADVLFCTVQAAILLVLLRLKARGRLR